MLRGFALPLGSRRFTTQFGIARTIKSSQQLTAQTSKNHQILWVSNGKIPIESNRNLWLNWLNHEDHEDKNLWIAVSMENSSQFWLLGAISPSYLHRICLPGLVQEILGRALVRAASAAMVQGISLLCSPTKQPEEPAPSPNHTASMPECEIGLWLKKSSRQPCNIMPQDPVPQLIEVHEKDQTKAAELDTMSATIWSVANVLFSQSANMHKYRFFW